LRWTLILLLLAGALGGWAQLPVATGLLEIHFVRGDGQPLGDAPTLSLVRVADGRPAQAAWRPAPAEDISIFALSAEPYRVTIAYGDLREERMLTPVVGATTIVEWQLVEQASLLVIPAWPDGIFASGSWIRAQATDGTRYVETAERRSNPDGPLQLGYLQPGAHELTIWHGAVLLDTQTYTVTAGAHTLELLLPARAPVVLALSDPQGKAHAHPEAWRFTFYHPGNDTAQPAGTQAPTPAREVYAGDPVIEGSSVSYPGLPPGDYEVVAEPRCATTIPSGAGGFKAPFHVGARGGRIPLSLSEPARLTVELRNADGTTPRFVDWPTAELTSADGRYSYRILPDPAAHFYLTWDALAGPATCTLTPGMSSLATTVASSLTLTPGENTLTVTLPGNYTVGDLP
jgi:hypothetical protein